MPFAGSDAELAEVCMRLEALEYDERDELIVADNRPGADAAYVTGDILVLGAGPPGSSYAARHAAATRASGDWLVFIDADCTPAPKLLDAYLADPVDDEVGVLAGAIVDVATGDSLTERYITARRKLAQETTLAHPFAPYGQTANLAVRRSAYEQVGGWQGLVIRSGGDADLCWRLRDAGWRLEARPAARVEHSARTRVRALVAQIARHGSGMAWLDERWPGSFPPSRPVPELTALIRGPDRRLAALDLAAAVAREAGRRRSNRVRA